MPRLYQVKVNIATFPVNARTNNVFHNYRSFMYARRSTLLNARAVSLRLVFSPENWLLRKRKTSITSDECRLRKKSRTSHSINTSWILSCLGGRGHGSAAGRGQKGVCVEEGPRIGATNHGWKVGGDLNWGGYRPPPVSSSITPHPTIVPPLFLSTAFPVPLFPASAFNTARRIGEFVRLPRLPSEKTTVNSKSLRGPNTPGPQFVQSLRGRVPRVA